MATQIAATPTVKGEKAIEIFNEANTKISFEAKVGAEKLLNKFKDKEIKK